ncbi:FKBP-type peptidyl-prolyl cis-trans isomerase [Compostimonas suwonensis]|uniref:FKBP-type peptidyl-prolyl cis-trans isomerase n=1 Tax=Compostimonas suwonensis TaxID=1048394 RepID=UPI001FE867AE|nr:FKBP-type peptidyl-prolyl cis-trans isomerase [Compostimonas suwonensis]
MASLAVLGLAGCSASSSDPSASPSASSAAAADCTDSGSISDGVKVSEDTTTKPTITIDGPLKADATERTVVVKGDGDAVEAGQQLEVAIAAFNGTTGAEITANGYDDAAIPITVGDANFLPGIVKAVNCSNVGDRVVAVVPPADAFQDQGSPDLGVGADDNIVFVVDVRSVLPSKAWGEDQPPVDGMPTVELADDGTPTVTIPDAPAPTDLKIAVLKKGDGDTVADGATVTVQYQGLLWDSGTIFDQSWGKSGPVQFQTSGVVQGFGQALVGQTVGSQILVSIPPALGYGDAGQPDAGISGTDTLVFVIDILATA